MFLCLFSEMDVLNLPRLSGYTHKRKGTVKNPNRFTVEEIVDFFYNSDGDLSEIEEMVEQNDSEQQQNEDDCK